MRRVTVRWHSEAVERLIELWMEADDPDQIRRAEFEIDVLLQVSPSTKGRAYALPLLEKEKPSSLHSVPVRFQKTCAGCDAALSKFSSSLVKRTQWRLFFW